MSETDEEQCDEILALSGILSPETFSTEVCSVGGHRGYIEVSVRLDSHILIVQPESKDDSSEAAPLNPSKVSFSVNHLPPVKLEFSLAPDYPALSAPLFHLSCPWITREQRDKASSHLKQLWEENRGSVILFLWINFLQEELLEFLDVGSEIDIGTITVKTRCLSGSKPEWKVIDDDEQEVIQSREDDVDNDTIDTPGPRCVKLRTQSTTMENSGSNLQKEILNVKEDSTRNINEKAGETTDKTKEKDPTDKSKTANNVLKRLDPDSVEDFKPRPSEKKIIAGPGVREGKVKFFNTKDLIGVIESGGQDVVVRHTAIVKNNPRKLEASLGEGEMVRFNTKPADWSFKGVRYKLEAVNVTGLDGEEVVGHKRIESVEVLEEGVEGTVIEWNSRFGEGRLKGGNWNVYIYFTCLHFTPQTLNNGDRVVFNVVNSKRWGVLANLVNRKVEEAGERRKRRTSNDEIEDEMMRMEKERSKEKEETTESKSVFGRIKKLRKDFGVIIGDDKMEYKVKGTDVADLELGVRVSFVIEAGKRTPKGFSGFAGKVTVIKEEDQCDSADASFEKPFEESEAETAPVAPEIYHASNFHLWGAKPKESISPTVSKAVISPPAPLEKDEASEKSKNPPKPVLERKRRNSTCHLATLLREYNNMKEETIFGTQLFTCEVCFTEKIGSSCIQFKDCGHVYCRDCMAGYFTVQISNAQVNNLTCPFSGCTTQALPNQVRELVPKDLFNKYENILLETTLDAMVDVIVCPRLACQCPTMIDRETNMGQCPQCSLTFCIYCKATYHGVSPCKFKSKEQRALVLKYSKGTDDEKLFLEKRYGKKQLQQAMALMLSEDYVQDNARHCPHCNAPIEKNEGCNKITCWRCNTHFCWLCTSRLPATNPYSHFNVPGSKCFGTLFQGVDPNDEDWVDDLEDDEDVDDEEWIAQAMFDQMGDIEIDNI